LVKDPDAAVDAAVSLGYPVALKIVSQEIPHKTEVGGVRVGLKRPEDVRWAFAEIVAAARRAVPAAKIDGIMVQRMAAVGRELIVGMARDPSFGPLVMFGLGGIYANALRDVVFRLAPLRRSDAAGMVRGIRGFRLLEAFRGTPAADLTALEDLLLRISQLAVDLPEIGELDLNPVLASKDGAVVADARMVFR
jgi:acyl-CoA synthetase (NDP forming)